MMVILVDQSSQSKCDFESVRTVREEIRDNDLVGNGSLVEKLS